MKRLVKINHKTLSVSEISGELPDEITGIAYSPVEQKVVFFQVSDGEIGFILEDGSANHIVRRLEVSDPTGFCCDEWGIAVFQPLPEMFWEFNHSFTGGVRLCGLHTHSVMGHTIHHEADAFSPLGMCRASRKQILLAMPWLHKIGMFNNGVFSDFAGTGKKGFSSSPNPAASRFDSPSGVCFDNASQTTFVADTDNAVVRALQEKNGCSFVGMPGNLGDCDGTGTYARFSKPTAIRTHGGKVAVADANLVRIFPIKNLDVSTVYKSTSIISDLAMYGDYVYVLEA